MSDSVYGKEDEEQGVNEEVAVIELPPVARPLVVHQGPH